MHQVCGKSHRLIFWIIRGRSTSLLTHFFFGAFLHRSFWYNWIAYSSRSKRQNIQRQPHPKKYKRAKSFPQVPSCRTVQLSVLPFIIEFCCCFNTQVISRSQSANESFEVCAKNIPLSTTNRPKKKKLLSGTEIFSLVSLYTVRFPFLCLRGLVVHCDWSLSTALTALRMIFVIPFIIIFLILSPAANSWQFLEERRAMSLKHFHAQYRSSGRWRWRQLFSCFVFNSLFCFRRIVLRPIREASKYKDTFLVMCLLCRFSLHAHGIF